MVEYVNKKTGAHISTDHAISGGDWELVKETVKKKKEEAK